jgi:thiol:disulfide interchange protein DsbA
MTTRRRALTALAALPALSLAALPTGALASPTAPRSGAEFITLPARQDVKAGPKQIEVIEFFMYHCPFCFHLEPELAAWRKRQGSAVAFRRVHLPYTGAADPEAHLFLTVEALGKGEEMFAKIEHAVHVERIRLNQEGPILEWVVKNGIEREQFLAAWNSFGVMTAMRRLPRIISDYHIESAPQLVVNGRYLTSPAQAIGNAPDRSPEAANTAVIAVLDALVAKAKLENGA